MKNKHDDFKNGVIKSNELKSVSGGNDSGTVKKYFIQKLCCVGCKECANVCSRGAISEPFWWHMKWRYEIKPSKCDGCGECIKYCRYNAIKVEK
jgi:NAD-dependent dihydropyrimidine dehydrogenase PreA subunit